MPRLRGLRRKVQRLCCCVMVRAGSIPHGGDEFSATYIGRLWTIDIILLRYLRLSDILK